MSLIGRIFRKIIPRLISYPLTCFKILELDYGHFITTLKWACVDKSGNPIPWYTYSAIDYLSQLDFSEKIVFEYGSGNSSLFWAARAKKVLSVEGDEKWYEKVLELDSPDNLSIVLVEDKEKYINQISEHSGFDVIIIDGSYREDCARYAVENLNPGGLIILDNADWFPEVADFIRNSLNLIQVDLKGFAPINFYTSTTSLFFHRDFNILPKNRVQPTPSPGAWKREF